MIGIAAVGHDLLGLLPRSLLDFLHGAREIVIIRPRLRDVRVDDDDVLCVHRRLYVVAQRIAAAGLYDPRLGVRHARARIPPRLLAPLPVRDPQRGDPKNNGRYFLREGCAFLRFLQGVLPRAQRPVTSASSKPREPAYQARFQKDYVLMERRGKKIEKLDKILDDLIAGRPHAPIHKDHALGHNWVGYRDCHIEGDWVLIYRIDPIPEDA